MPKDAKVELIKLAADYPELAHKILAAGGWIPGELKDDTYDTGHIEEHEILDPNEDEGSQVPPVRDSKGVLVEKYDKEAHADAWAKAASRHK